MVAQIPSLLLSLSTAILVTRVTTDESMPEQASKQVADEKAVFIASGIIVLLGLIPGMPHFVFLPLGAAGVGLGYYLRQQSITEKQRQAETNTIEEYFLTYF